MTRILALLALLAVALGVAVWRAPASLIAGVLPANVARVVQLHELTGTIWQGRALFTLIAVPPSLSVTWQCRPSLAPLGVRCELGESVTAAITLDVLSSTANAQRVTLSVPVQFAVGGATVASSPNVDASLADVVVTRSSLRVKGSIRATEATYRMGTTDVALGEITADCAPATADASSSCTIANRGGNARLDGKLLLMATRASGSLELTPTNGPTQRVDF